MSSHLPFDFREEPPREADFVSSILTAAGADKANPDYFYILRYAELEIYSIKSAQWNLYALGQTGRWNFWICIHGCDPIQQSEGSAYVLGLPYWELSLVRSDIKDANLVPGYSGYIPEGHDKSVSGCVANFAFVGQEFSYRNRITILDRKGDRLLIRMTGETVDILQYDDTKPRARLLVETWVHRFPEGRASTL